MQLLLTLIALIKFIEPITVLLDGDHDKQMVRSDLESPEQVYRLKRVELSSANRYCVMIAKNLNDAVPPKRIAEGCFPGGPASFRFEDGESDLTGGPGTAFVIILYRVDKGDPPSAVFVRGVIETSNVPVPPKRGK